MQEAVCGDVEGDPHLPPLDPCGLRNDAPVSPVLLPGLGEGPEGMLSQGEGSRPLEEIHIYLPDQGPTPRMVEGGGRFRNQSDLIAVTSGSGVESGVEVLRNPYDPLYPDIPREEGVQRPMELRDIPPGWKGQGYHLPRGMDSGVRSSGGRDGVPCPGEAFQGVFEDTLHGSAPGLELPAQEIGPVVMQDQTKTFLGFGSHAGQGRWVVGGVKKGWPEPQTGPYPYPRSMRSVERPGIARLRDQPMGEKRK